jgi:hypothetical protein
LPLISVLSVSSEILSSTCSSLLEWPSTVFYVSVWFFFLRFSISWITSSLIFSNFIFNSFIYLYCSLFDFGIYSGLLWVFISVSSHILYFWCLEISWVHLVHFFKLHLVSSSWKFQWLLAGFLLEGVFVGIVGFLGVLCFVGVRN